MNRRRFWWSLLILYTVALWAATLGCCALMAAIPTNWTYDGVELPPLMILQNALWTLGPAFATAAFALLAATVAIGLLRSTRTPAAPVDEADPWPDDVVFVEPASRERQQRVG